MSERTILDVVAEGGVRRPGVRMVNASFRYSNGVMLDLDDEAVMEFEGMIRLLTQLKNVMESASAQQARTPREPAVDSEALRNFLGNARTSRKTANDKKDKEEPDKSGE